MNTAALLIALEALRKIRDAKAPEDIIHSAAWFEGYARHKAEYAVSTIEKLVGPKFP